MAKNIAVFTIECMFQLVSPIKKTWSRYLANNGTFTNDVRNLKDSRPESSVDGFDDDESWEICYENGSDRADFGNSQADKECNFTTNPETKINQTWLSIWKKSLLKYISYGLIANFNQKLFTPSPRHSKYSTYDMIAGETR